MNLANRFGVAMLRSPLWWLGGSWLIVITYTGRRSGRRFSVPVQYTPGPDGTMVVLVGNSDSKTWWRNFRRPQPVTVRTRGRDVEAVAQLAPDDPELRFRLMKAYRTTFSRTLQDGRPAMWRKPWRPSDDELRAVATGETFVVLEPVKRLDQPTPEEVGLEV